MSLPRDNAIIFDLREHGPDLLKLLSDLITQESADLWGASGLFSAANGVLLLALFSTPATPRSLLVLGGFGLLLSFAWMIAIATAWIRIGQWTKKAKALETRLGIPPDLAPWVETVRVRRLSNPSMMFIVDLVFYAFWAYVVLAAGTVAGIWHYPAW